MTYNAADYVALPPIITQARMNRILADFWATINGFTPSGTFTAPYTYIISKNGIDYYASNAYQTVYGGSADAGGINGADYDAVWAAVQAALVEGDTVVFKKGTYPVSVTMNPFPHDKISFFMEKGALLQATALLTGDILANTDTTRYCNLVAYLDCNSKAGVSGCTFPSLQASNIEVLEVFNCTESTLYAINLTSDGSSAGIEGVHNNVWNKIGFIYTENCYNGLNLAGASDASAALPDNHFNTIIMDAVSGVGINMKEYVDDNVFDFVFINLHTNNAVGININDHGDFAQTYGNKFGTVIVDPIDKTGCVGVRFNYTQLNEIDLFMWGQVSGIGGITGTPYTQTNCFGNQIRSLKTTITELTMNVPESYAHFDMNNFIGLDSPVVVGTGNNTVHGLGLCQISTGATANSAAINNDYIYYGGSTDADYTLPYELIFVMSVGGSVNTSKVWLKLDDGVDAADPNSKSVGFRFDNLAAYGVVHNGTTKTETSLGNIVSDVVHAYRIVTSSNCILFMIDDIIKGVQLTNLPTGAMTAGQILTMAVINGATGGNHYVNINRIIYNHHILATRL